MKIILLEDIPALGDRGDVVNVAEGYGRNYLIPKKKALLANESNLKTLQERIRVENAKSQKEKGSATKLADTIETLSLHISKNVGEDGKLFGSVTSIDIEEALSLQGISVERKKIIIDEPIKQTGDYTVKIKVHPEVVAHLSIAVTDKQ
ncbi:MAG: 50S ribosomal protein L9 [Thermodesulfobacteriota bacterium]|nr:50S ribosomal protein L9 [Thermodesulfobacteriota bacterium]